MAYQIVERSELNIGQRIHDRYVVEKVLGEGSFGKVYRVKDMDGTIYALKLLHLWDVAPDIRQPLMERFEMEFKTGQIGCDYLVQSVDYGKIGGNPYIVMEFCPGGDLTPILGKEIHRIPEICQQILLGLRALHINGKVHRDLKPENVLIKANGVAALTDFDQVLSLNLLEAAEALNRKQAEEAAANADPVVDALVEARTAAKKAKNAMEKLGIESLSSLCYHELSDAQIALASKTLCC